MPITVQCKCGKRLKAPDAYAGKRVKCPGCGKPVAIPAPAKEEEGPMLDFSAQEKEKCPSCSSPLDVGAVLCTTCGYNKTTGAQAEVRKLKAQKPRGEKSAATGSAGGGIGAMLSSITSSIPVVPIVLVAVALGVIWGGMKIYKGFMNPPPVAGYSVSYVDAYAVADGLETIALAGAIGGNLQKLAGDLALGGNRTLLLTKDAANGRFIRLKVRLAKKYFENQGRVRSSEMMIDVGDLKLIGPDGVERMGIFLIGQYDQKPLAINIERFPKDGSLPFSGASLEVWRHPGTEQGELKPQYLMDDIYKQEFFQGAAGSWQFTGDTGMSIRVEGDGKRLIVSWESPTTAWRAGRDLKDSAVMFDTFGEWEVDLLFAKPPGAGGYQLKVGEYLIPITATGGGP